MILNLLIFIMLVSCPYLLFIKKYSMSLYVLSIIAKSIHLYPMNLQTFLVITSFSSHAEITHKMSSS